MSREESRMSCFRFFFCADDTQVFFGPYGHFLRSFAACDGDTEILVLTSLEIGLHLTRLYQMNAGTSLCHCEIQRLFFTNCRTPNFLFHKNEIEIRKKSIIFLYLSSY